MIDTIVLAIIAVSALLGLLRGFISTIVGIVSWLLAFWAAFHFGKDASYWLSGGSSPTAMQYLAGYGLVFLAVLVAVSLLGALVRAGVRAVRLGALDRLLGLLLGTLRGAILVCAGLLVVGFTPLQAEPAWRQSSLLPLLRPVAEWMRIQLPANWGSYMDLGWQPVPGDNADLGMPEARSTPLAEAVTRALQQRAQDAPVDQDGAAERLQPAAIEPAQSGVAADGPQRQPAENRQQ